MIFLPLQCSFFFFNDTATTEIYTSLHTLSLHDALPICTAPPARSAPPGTAGDAASSAWGVCRSEEHTSELQSRNDISYAVFCLKKKKKKKKKKNKQRKKTKKKKKKKKKKK